jgi:hypothetical protein
LIDFATGTARAQGFFLPLCRYNTSMLLTRFLLYLFFFVGMAFTAALAQVKPARTRRALLAAGLLLVNLGWLAVLLASFLAARLEGSTPPTLLEHTAQFWLQLALLAGINGVMVYLYRNRPDDRREI